MFNLYIRKEFLNRDIFGEGVEISFEDRYYTVPYNSRNYLSYIYGDYMKLPLEKERISGHDCTITWK